MPSLIEIQGALSKNLLGISTLEISTILSEFGQKFRALNSIEVPSSLSFSNLMGQINETTASLGTILNSDGAPTAVVFNMSQYKKVTAIIEFIPSIIETLHHLSEKYVELQIMGSRMLSVTSPILKGTVYITAFGSIALIWGAYRLGKDQEKPDLQNNQPKRVYSLFPCISIGVGVCAIAFSMYLTNKAGDLTAGLGKALAAQ